MRIVKAALTWNINFQPDGKCMCVCKTAGFKNCYLYAFLSVCVCVCQQETKYIVKKQKNR